MSLQIHADGTGLSVTRAEKQEGARVWSSLPRLLVTALRDNAQGHPPYGSGIVSRPSPWEDRMKNYTVPSKVPVTLWGLSHVLCLGDYMNVPPILCQSLHFPNQMLPIPQ